MRVMQQPSDAALPILIVPDRRLKSRARPVTPADAAAVRALVPRLFRTMYEAPGIGLAAPQVGEMLRLIVVDLMRDNSPEPRVLVNPTILRVGAEWVLREEGCLSLPGMYADVTRPGEVTVSYHDLDGKPQRCEADGLLAACLQHEIDHLTPLRRNMLLRRLAKEQKIKASA